MAVNKNAQLRYNVLDRCFRNTGRRYFWEDLLADCNTALRELEPDSEGIKRRQLFDDIRFMESEQGWFISLARHQFGKKVFYRYEDPAFSINNQLLNKSEAEQIRASLQIFSRFAGTPQFAWVNEMIPMLESKLGLVEHKKEVICFESNVDLTGLDFLLPLFNAIIHERVLAVQYKDFKNPEPYEVIFHPHYLKQYNNRWFAFGLHPEYGIHTWNLALDRILSLEETTWVYQHSAIDWDDYFYDIIGVTRTAEAQLQEVVLLFSPEVAPYVTTKPLHPSQKHRKTEAGLEVRISVYPNVELERVILSFGEQVEVLGPEGLRGRILERLKIASTQYRKQSS